MKLGAITASEDMGRSVVLYNHLAKVGMGVLAAHSKEIGAKNKDSIQGNVSKDVLNAMQRFMEGWGGMNLDGLLIFCRG